MPDYGDVDPNTGQPSARTQYSGTFDPNAPSVSNGQISPAAWAEYRRQRRKAAIIGVITTLGGMMAAPAASYGAGGAAVGGGTAASGALPAIEGGATWAVTPYAGTASMVPTGAAAVGGTIGTGASIAAGGGGGAANTIRDAADTTKNSGGGGDGDVFAGMSAREIAAIVASLGGTVGGALTDKPNTTPSSATMDPSLKALIDMQMKRMNQQQPLFESINAMANGLLPTQYQRGGGGMG